MGLYRWLRGKVTRALPVYSLGMMVFIPIVLFADQVIVQRGALAMERGYSVYNDMAAGVVVMVSPVLFYELALKASSTRAQGTAKDR